VCGRLADTSAPSRWTRALCFHWSAAPSSVFLRAEPLAAYGKDVRVEEDPR